MGRAGPRAYRYYTNPLHADYLAFLYGPDDETKNRVDVMRRQWRHGGGREAVLEHCPNPKKTWAWERFENGGRRS
jgi:hypothetical protein